MMNAEKTKLLGRINRHRADFGRPSITEETHDLEGWLGLCNRGVIPCHVAGRVASMHHSQQHKVSLQTCGSQATQCTAPTDDGIG
jgi:hypothetical protein